MTEKVLEITGIVTQVSPKDGKYGFKIGEDWYNGFGDLPCEEGDTVKVKYIINKQWNNVEEVEVITSAPASQPEMSRSDAIGETALRRHKLDCLLKSVDAWIAGMLEKEEVIDFGLGLFEALGIDYQGVDEANQKPEVKEVKP